MLSRRVFFEGAAGASLLAIGARSALPNAVGAELKSITAGAKPISAEERRGRIAKVQALMEQRTFWRSAE